MLLAESGPENLQSLAVAQLCLGILARGLKHASEVVEHGGGFRRSLAVLAVGELQQLFETSARGLVKLCRGLAPFDLNGGDLAALESGLPPGGGGAGTVPLVMNRPTKG